MKNLRLHHEIDVFEVAVVATIVAFPRSFLLLKAALIFLYVLSKLARSRSTKWIINRELLVFYLAVAGLGIIWSWVGLLRGNPIQALIDNLRLYVVWSAAFILIFTLLRGEAGRNSIHASLILSAYLIFLVNICGVIDSWFGLNLIENSIRKELDLFVGFHDGYIQVTSHNIGSLFFLIPYFYVILANERPEVRFPRDEWIALMLLVVVAIVSGRRALWICVALTPLIDQGLSIIANSHGKTLSRYVIATYVLFALAVAISAINLDGDDFATLAHMQDAFSDLDERSIQLKYLIDGFFMNPIFGSGFGGYAGYTRNEVAPWLYELTYWQLLFNFGVIGVSITLVFVLVYVTLALKSVGSGRKYNPRNAALCVGVLSLLIGSYSNPYLGSFDFLFLLGLIPYMIQDRHKRCCGDRV